LCKNTLLHFPHLETEGRGKLSECCFVIRIAGNLRDLREAALHFSELSADFNTFLAAIPRFVPVNVAVRSRRGTNNVQHPFSRVGITGTWESAVAFEITGENVGIITDGTEVDCAATFSKEEKTIESLEQHG